MPLTLLLAALLLAACEQEQGGEIQWRLPLQAPEDLHGVQMDTRPVPDWAMLKNGTAEFVWLQKSTARTFTVAVPLGDTGEIQGWQLHLLGLASGLKVKGKSFLNDENVDNPAAFVEISRDGQIMYRGWLYQNFPELFGLDDPDWKVWLKGIKLRTATDKATQGTRSSAG